jgi:DNA-binding GntR family transcriptional regulator
MSHDITASLRQAILEGRLQPGERVGQASIADEHGVSRIPVREALRQLETEGLIRQIPHAGARVSDHTVREVHELYLLRESLEPLLLEHSVMNLTEGELDELRESMDRVKSAEGDVQAWLLEDRIFHLSSFRAAGMPTAFNLVERFYNQTQAHRRRFFGTLDEQQIDIFHLEHRLILDAIERGAAEEAADLQRLHIRHNRKRLADALRELEGDT